MSRIQVSIEFGGLGVVLDGVKALRYGISTWGLLLVKGRCVGLLGEGAMGCWLEGRVH